MPVLSCHGVSCHAGEREIVADFAFELAEGERVALMGPSGSGKTTLLTTLAGLRPPSAGHVSRTAPVTLVFQSYGLLALLTAAENVEVALRAAGHTGRDAMRRADAVLASLGLSEYAGHLVEELSGGQQQRVAVARALAVGPRVLLADEPTAEQDSGNRELVLKELLAAEAALVIATHDPEVADRCDRVVTLR
ncbi:ABC transporter ATP-binding protein [Acrocarpospora phusangensis]|uniref:ABC transporter ATP-binding protein n=1 Tax=Acrocarpospora phusangensis TaxID=1070424 RepID=A0A919UPB7_9ACTN|nr:ATP-binding cassette domain-containing protein [Acrocarpospora phusangensis]GIH28699.1 ABC transporter ATP-binding protein [Acrocarpospora phusangensis]